MRYGTRDLPLGNVTNDQSPDSYETYASSWDDGQSVPTVTSTTTYAPGYDPNYSGSVVGTTPVAPTSSPSVSPGTSIAQTLSSFFTPTPVRAPVVAQPTGLAALLTPKNLLIGGGLFIGALALRRYAR